MAGRSSDSGSCDCREQLRCRGRGEKKKKKKKKKKRGFFFPLLLFLLSLVWSEMALCHRTLIDIVIKLNYGVPLSSRNARCCREERACGSGPPLSSPSGLPPPHRHNKHTTTSPLLKAVGGDFRR
uniref:Uncharacterized protein n=1 Tax=Oryza glumipatula TaxID=40148 RepID=A0A0E0AGG2_9ORYZ